MTIYNTLLARENVDTKYRYNNESDLGTFIRVCTACAKVELNYGATQAEVDKWVDTFLKMMVKFVKVPNGTQGPDIYVDPEGVTWEGMGLKATTGGRITANAGTEFDSATLLNCFINYGIKGAKITYNRSTPDGKHVIPVTLEGDPDTADDLTNIMVTLAGQALTLSNEGGYGINFDFIRPRGALIKGTGVRHPGVMAYMEVWDTVADMIVRGDQDGYSDTLTNHLPQSAQVLAHMEKAMPRKGAQMGCLSISHPDIEEFVRSKQTKGVLTKFNISVVVDDAFMNAVEKDTSYDLHFDGVIYKRIQARDLYNLIMECTYLRNEPGILYDGNINNNNPLLYLGRSNASNPCGEIDGNPYITTVCLLGSINLTMFVDPLTREFDWVEYDRVVRVFARMLENVNDIGNVPLPEYKWALENVRQYGMGVNGLGSVHYMMGMTYGSEESLEFTYKINALKENATWQESALLARDRGPAPAFDDVLFFETPWFVNNTVLLEETKDLMRKYGVRNLKTTTNPPLGNSSVICDMVSNGIEPVFSHGYDRTVISHEWPEGLSLDNIKTQLKETVAGDAIVWQGEIDGRMWYYEPHNRGLCFIESVLDYGYSWVKEHYPEDVSSESPASYLVTAQDLPVMTHVAVQAEVQKCVNQAVSKTCNLPNDYPFEDYKDLYIKAWQAGLKGFTTYRSGTMESVLAVAGSAPVASTLLESLLAEGHVPEGADLTESGVIIREVRLPDEYNNGSTKKVKADGNKYYMHLSYLQNDPEHPVALWVHSNGALPGEYVSLNRATRSVVKLLKDSGVALDLVEEQLGKTKDDPYHVRLGKIVSMAMRHCIPVTDIVFALSGVDGDHIASTVTAVRKYLSMHIADGTKVVGKTCSSCGSENIIFESGCDKCLDCGHSGC